MAGSNLVNFEADKQVLAEDLNNIEAYTSQTFIDLIKDAIDPSQKYAGLTVVQNGPTGVNVGLGRYYSGGQIYVNAQTTPFSFTTGLPVVTQKIATIVAWGAAEPTNVQPRAFIINADTGQFEPRNVAMETSYIAQFAVVYGAESASPARGQISSGALPICDVLLSPSGIISIIMDPTNALASVSSNFAMLASIIAWQNSIGSILATLRSDLAALAKSIQGLAPMSLTTSIAEGLARVNDTLGIPQTYLAYHADVFLDNTYSDTANIAYYAKVDNGIRFPDYAINDVQLGVLNPNDSNIVINGNFVMPAYDLVLRLSGPAGDTPLSISQYQYQTVAWRQKSYTRTRVRYGNSFTVCTNSAWWQAGRYDPLTNIFQLTNGETFSVVSGNAAVNHQWVYVKEFWTDSWTETYWEAAVTNQNISGSYIAETFLNAQAGYLVELDLYFQSVGSSGDVHVAICETVAGAPDVTNVIGVSTLTFANIKQYISGNPSTTSKVVFSPVLLDAGKRYAIIISTTGNHYVWMATNSNFTDGTLFHSTDGSWFSGDLTKDICFDLYFAQFRSSYVATQLNPLQLAGGITAVDILAVTAIPSPTAIDYQVQIGGKWVNLDETLAASFAGLPALLPFQVVFSGSQSLMPMLGTSSNSRVRTTRPALSFLHISTALTTTTSANITVHVRVESWLTGGADTLAGSLLSGSGFSTETAASASTSVAAPDDATARIFTFTFTSLSPALTTFKLKLVGAIANALTPFHVAIRTDVDLT